jgi:anthranilate synthase component 1
MTVAPTSGLLRIEPTLERARELAGSANAIPIRASFVDDCETPVSAFLKLREPGAPSFLLESAEQGRLGRYSFIGFRPRTVLRWTAGELTEWPQAGSDEGAPSPAPDPYAAVRDHLAGYSVAAVDGLPPFAGGAVGFFGYDLVRAVEPLGEPNPDPVGLPDMALIVSEALVAFDHMRHELTLIAYAFTDDGTSIDEAYDRALATIAEAHERLRGPVPASPERPPADPPPFESNMSRAGFEANVARIIEYIRAGDAFQVVPSQRFSAPATVEAFSIYRGLRTVNPSPYMYFLDFGDFQIAGASPEPLVKVTGRRAETRPIAGTYPRGQDEEEDRRQAEALLGDPKERA